MARPRMSAEERAIRQREAKRLYMERWSAQNPEEKKRRDAANYAAHRDRIRARHATYYDARRDEINAKHRADAGLRERSNVQRRQRRKDNSDLIRQLDRESLNRWRRMSPAGLVKKRADKQAQRARQQGVTGGLTRTQLQEAIEASGGRCWHCLSVAPLTIDHVTPLSANGPNTVENIALLCWPCNQRKGTRSLLAWLLVAT